MHVRPSSLGQRLCRDLIDRLRLHLQRRIARNETDVPREVSVDLLNVHEKRNLGARFCVRRVHTLVEVTADGSSWRGCQQRGEFTRPCPISPEKNLAHIGLGTHVDDDDRAVWVLLGVRGRDSERDERFSDPAFVVPDRVSRITHNAPCRYSWSRH